MRKLSIINIGFSKETKTDFFFVTVGDGIRKLRGKKPVAVFPIFVP